MKLKEIIKNKRHVNIEYRTHYRNMDMLVGFCCWEYDELIPLDGDSYSVEDEISYYEWSSKNDLTVWYESNWIEG